MTHIQWISLIGSLFFLVLVMFAIYRGYLREGYALLWIAVTGGLIVLALLPRILDWIANIVGIYTPAFVLVLFMLAGMLLVLFQQSVIISRHNEKIKRLTEELTLLKANKKE